MTENTTRTPPPTEPPPAGPDPRYARPPGAGSAFDDVLARLRAGGYARDTDARWFGGVCSGLAQRWDVDPVVIRAAVVLLTFFGGLGVTAYVVAWLVLPDRRGDVLVERALRRGDAGPVALLVLTGLLLVGAFLSVGHGDGWVAPLWVLALAGVAWLLVRRDRVSGNASPMSGPGPYGPTPPPPGGGVPTSAPTTAFSPARTRTTAPPGPYGGQPVPPAPPRAVDPPPPPRPRRRRPSWYVGLISVGIALIGLGLGTALDAPTGFPGTAGTLGLLLGLTGVSLVVLTLGLSGRAAGFSGVVTVVLALLLVSSAAVSRLDVESSGFGPRVWTPVPGAGETRFEHGGGDVVLDLRGFADAAPAVPADGAAQVLRVEVGGGDLTIRVPQGVSARVDAEVGFGSIVRRSADGSTAPDSTGPDRSVTTTLGDGPIRVVVDARLGVGQITIEELE